MKNDNRGMSYIEVLMAAALLSIFIVPVLSGFFNASRNQRYALTAYEASLYTANLLTEAGAGISSDSDNFASILRNPAFSDEYKTDIYDYCLYVYSRRADGLNLEFFAATNPDSEPSTAMPIFSGDIFPQSTVRQITTNTDYHLSLIGNTDIFVDGNDFINITCENASSEPVLLNIYAHDPGRINVDCINAGAGLTVSLAKPNPIERIVMAEAYDKNGELLNRLAVPIIYSRGNP